MIARAWLCAALVSSLALVSCGGGRTLGLGPNADASSTGRTLSPKALQQNTGAPFVEFPSTCDVPLGQLSQGATGTSMWFSVPTGCTKKAAGFVAKVEIATGQVTSYALGKAAEPLAIAENANYVWVADQHKENGKRLIYQFQEDGTSTSFALPSAITVTSLAAGPDGNLWFCGSYVSKKTSVAGYGYVTPSGATKLYELKASPEPLLTSIAAGSDGDLYATDENGNIDQISPATGAVTTFSVGGHPSSITNSSNVMVYSDASSAQLSVITKAGKFVVYPAPSGERPGFLARKSDGTVLYIDTENNSNAIGTFEPSKGIYESEAQAPNAGLRYLYNGPDGNMWFTDAYGHVGAYLKFILQTNPPSISLDTTTCSTTFTVSEPNYSGSFSVASGNSAVASVSPATGTASTTFTVTETGSGSTTISVQDSMQNVVALPVSSAGDGSGNPVTFEYTGGSQCFIVPQNITDITVTAVGAAGGPGAGGGSNGGSATATISVTPGETLAVNVGGEGNYGGGYDDPFPGSGGFNGGASGSAGHGSCYDICYGAGGGGGGGASDVREGGSGIANRVVVGGGGGGGGNGGGGSGGGLSGGNGSGDSCSSDGGPGGSGGTQTTGGAGGSGGVGTGYDSNFYCGDGSGGGGGGYYGGLGGSYGGAGGGGSAYAEPSATNVSYASGTNNNYGYVTISWSSNAVRKRTARSKAR
jgi:streptogramin lyase